MEANNQAITGENNLPELIQDKFGDIKELASNQRKFAEIAGSSAKQMQEAIQKMEKAFHSVKNIPNIR